MQKENMIKENNVKDNIAKENMVKEKSIVAILSFLNFTHIIDFMILMPLSPQLMRVFEITPSEFSYAVGAYTNKLSNAQLFPNLDVNKNPTYMVAALPAPAGNAMDRR